MEVFIGFYSVIGVLVFVVLATFPTFELKNKDVVIYSSIDDGVWYKDILLAFLCAVMWLPLVLGALIMKDKES